MKILIINKFLFPKGGDAVVALAEADLLRAAGHEVVLWGMTHPSNPSYPHADCFTDYADLEGGGGLAESLRLAANLLYSSEAKRKLETLLTRIGRPDVVHVHNIAHQISPSILHVFKRLGIPVVMTAHDYKLVCGAYTMLSRGAPCERCSGGKHYHCALERCVKGSALKSLLNTAEMYLHHDVLGLYDSLRTVIVPSLFALEKQRAMGSRQRLVHLPNFVDLAHEPRYGGAGPVVVYCGRLSHEKGVATLLRAVRGLPLELRIIGDGPLRPALEEQVAREGIGNASFLGRLSGEALRDAVRSAQFTVVPSEFYENFSMSVLESFALGKAVIGARIGGIPEAVVPETTGLLFEAGDADGLRAAVSRLLESPTLAVELGRAARLEAEKKYGPGPHLERLLGIYAEAIRG